MLFSLSILSKTTFLALYDPLVVNIGSLLSSNMVLRCPSNCFEPCTSYPIFSLRLSLCSSWFLLPHQWNPWEVYKDIGSSKRVQHTLSIYSFDPQSIMSGTIWHGIGNMLLLVVNNNTRLQSSILLPTSYLAINNLMFCYNKHFLLPFRCIGYPKQHFNCT